MRGSGPILLLTVGMLLVAAVFLKGLAGDAEGDPRVSIDNGAAAGTLGLALLLEQHGVDVRAWKDHAAALPDGRALFVAPPPEASEWKEEEVDAVLERVRRGAFDALLICDERRARRAAMSAWWRRLGIVCGQGVEGNDSEVAHGTLPAYDATLRVRGRARVSPEKSDTLLPAWVDEGAHVVVLRGRLGAGAVTVLASPTVLANDGIGRADNARFFLSLVPPDARVVFDEAHHRLRGAETLDRAFAQTGPQVGTLALVLLVPFVLLGFVPRRGDAPDKERDPPFLAARRAARALAALYVRAGVADAHDADDRRAVDREPPPDRRSAA